MRESSAERDNLEKNPIAEAKERLHATSIVLQQGREESSVNLFLFPDGSGSAASYAMLPEISPYIRVYGLNCPLRENPEKLRSCSLRDFTEPYLAEIRRCQQQGPYNLSGWSSGGIAAYEAAQQLVLQGERVEQLILIDSPNPIGLGKLPARLFDFLEHVGVFGMAPGVPLPTGLRQRFLAIVEVLDSYVPDPFSPVRAAPRTTAIWARDGVCKNASDPRPEQRSDDPREMGWMLENRENLGPYGWDRLIGKDNVDVQYIPDANHFTLIRSPRLGRLIGQVMLSD